MCHSYQRSSGHQEQEDSNDQEQPQRRQPAPSQGVLSSVTGRPRISMESMAPFKALSSSIAVIIWAPERFDPAAPKSRQAQLALSSQMTSILMPVVSASAAPMTLNSQGISTLSITQVVATETMVWKVWISLSRETSTARMESRFLRDLKEKTTEPGRLPAISQGRATLLCKLVLTMAL